MSLTLFGPVTGVRVSDEVDELGLEDTVIAFDEFVELVATLAGLDELAAAVDVVLVVVLVSIVTSSDVVADELDADGLLPQPASRNTHRDITVSSETNFKCFINTLLLIIIII